MLRSLPTSLQPMVGTTREWITIPVAGKDKGPWQIDVTFLASSWRCIFGQGCQGVLTEPAPELVQGCCSYGAYESEKKVKEKVEKLAKKLGDDELHSALRRPPLCRKLPLLAVARDEEDESITSVLTEFGRDGWGEGGEEFG